MKFKSLKVVLIMLLGMQVHNIQAEQKSMNAAAAVKFEKAGVERDLNLMFVEALKASVAQLAENYEVPPYAFVLKTDGTIGYFAASGQNKDLSIVEQSQRIKRMLHDLAGKGSINASIQAMYATVKLGESSSQGMLYEVEHRAGISFKRFLPMEAELDENGKENGKYLLNTSKMTTSAKPKVIFEG